MSSVGFASIWLAATIGAFMGDWVAYELTRVFKDGIANIWPLSRNPQMLVKGKKFFDRWGIASVFFGRFFGPLRAIVPLVAGACGMTRKWFQIANLSSAIVWASGILTPGYLGLRWLLL
jgi:membrane protein DedA with SNARE-associated domain